MPTQQNITIKIADVAPISMTIAPETEEVVRLAEYNVNKVWNAWRAKFVNNTAKEVLAMVTFQFAKRYYQLVQQSDLQKDLLEGFEAELDRLLDIVNAADEAGASPDAATDSKKA